METDDKPTAEPKETRKSLMVPILVIGLGLIGLLAFLRCVVIPDALRRAESEVILLDLKPGDRLNPAPTGTK